MFGIFKKNKEKLKQKTEIFQIRISYSTSTTEQKYELNEIERVFIVELFNRMKAKNLDYNLIDFRRMGDGTLNACYKGAQIGRIKLQGRKTKMQILNPIDVKWFADESIEFYIEKLDFWINYIDKHLRKT